MRRSSEYVSEKILAVWSDPVCHSRAYGHKDSHVEGMAEKRRKKQPNQQTCH
jgi:hypothetical protein